MLDSEQALGLVLESFHVLGMTQSGYEARDFAMFVSGNDIANILELGTGAGGMMYLMDRAAKPGLRISIDRVWWERDPIMPDGWGKKFKSLLPHVIELTGEIHDIRTREKLAAVLAGEKLDLIFQDSDHTADGARKDFYDYMQFVRPGGYFAFHDVRNGHGTQAAYDEISKGYRHWEYTEAKNLFGIGILQLP